MARGQRKEEGNAYFQSHFSEYLRSDNKEKLLSDKTGLSQDAVEVLMRNGKGECTEEFEEFCDEFVVYLRQLGVDIQSIDRNATLHYLNVMQGHTRH
jgi:hypothetical protein